MVKMSIENLPPTLKKIRLVAIEATNRCRFLKSTTYVGVALLSTYHKVYSGCNFDYEFGIARHGEDTAICNFIINSVDVEELIDSVYLYVPKRKEFTPCGNCRDKLRLFAENKETLKIYLDNGEDVRVFSLNELIPFYPMR